ncbi:unnamed protein product [Leuciscus chuanchicus]
MKIESEMVEMAVMRAEEKQTELMEPTAQASYRVTMYFYAKNKLILLSPTAGPQNPNVIQRNSGKCGQERNGARPGHTDQNICISGL